MKDERILIVDDDLAVLQLCTRVLQKQEYELVAKSIASKAVALLEREQFDLLLLDLKMPDMDGLTLLRRAKELDPSLMAVIITGYGTMQTAIDALNAGARGFLLKPFGASELLEAVEHALRARRQEQEDLLRQAQLPILEISQTLMVEGEMQALPQRLAEIVGQQVRADRASLLLLDEEGRKLHIAGAFGLAVDATSEIRIPADQGTAARVLSQKEPFIPSEETEQDPFLQALGIGSDTNAVCVPLHSGRRVVGMLGLGRLNGGAPFSLSELNLLSIVGGQIAATLESATLYEAVVRSKSEWEATFDAIADGIALIGADHRLLRVNRTLAQWLDTAPEALVGRSGYEIFGQSDSPAEDCIAAQAMQSKQARRLERKVPALEGIFLCSAYPLRDSQGDVTGVVQVLRDITQRKQIEEELRRQNEYLAALHEIGLGLITRRDLAELLEAIIARACALLDTAHGYIYLLVPGESEMELRTGTGAYGQHAGHRLNPGEDLAGQVWQSGQSLVVDDYCAWPDRAPDPEFDVLHGALGIPLTAGSQVIGVLGLGYATEGREIVFEEIALLSQFAELASIALDNAGLYEQAQQELEVRTRAEEALQRRVAQLALLNRVGSKIEALLEVDSVLDLAARLVQESFGYHHVAVFTLDRAREELLMKARAGRFADLFPPEHRLDLSQGIVGWAARHGEKRLANDVSQDPHFVNLYANILPTRAELSVPIRIGGETVGVLDAQSPQANAFDENDVMVMETVAGQIAVAIENAQLYEAVQRELAERKIAEEALRTSEERFRQFFENEPGYCYMVSTEGIIVDVNRAALKALGYKKAELVGEPLSMIYAPESLPTAKQLFAEWTRTGQIQDEELVIVTKEGKRRTVLFSADVVRDRDGHVLHSISVQRDITERKEVQEALLESEEKYRLLFENMMNGFALHEIVLNKKGKPIDYVYLEVNSAFEQLTGLERKNLIGHKVTEALPGIEKDPADWIGLYGQVALSGQEIRFEQYAQPLGKWYSVLTFSPRKGQFATVFEDITERKQAEEALREERDRAQKYLDIAGVMFVAVDTKGTVTLINQRGSEILGYEQEEILGKNWFDHFLPARMREEVRTVFDRLVAGEIEPLEYYENPILTKDGEERIVAWHNTTLRDDKGRVFGTLSSGEDITKRKQAEEALRESEARYRTLFEQANDAILLNNESDEILDANRRACELWGYSREELLALKVPDLQAPEVRGQAGTVIRAELEAYKGGPFESIDLHREGMRIPVEVSTTRLESKEPGLILSIVRDITERKQAEMALRQSEARYRSFVEQSYEGVLELDSSAITVFANSRMAQILGYGSPEELIGQRFHEFAPRINLDGSPALAEDRQAGETRVQDCVFQKKDGSAVYAILSILRRRSENESFGGATLFVTDITERKQAEEALKESENRYRTLFESAGDAIFIYDLTGRFLAVNRLACERLGYSQEELLQMTPAEIELPEYAALLPQRIEELRRFGHHFFETAQVPRDGAAIPTELSSRLIEYGGQPAILSIARDITERKQMQQALLRTERLAAMGHLAAALAHEINNPLQSVGNSMELVLDFPLEQEEREEYLEAVRQEIDRLMALTTRILDFARPARTKRHPLCVSESVRYALTLADKQLQHSRIGLNTVLPDDLPAVRASHDQLAQVFLNLILNAVEAMPGGGRLEISARAAEEKVTVTFADSGPGIPPDILDKMFEPFQTTKDEGTGLGLAVSYSIVQQHGGIITAENAPGGGAVFTVSLPLDSQ